MLSIRFWLLKSESTTATHFILQVSISYKGVRASAKSTGIVIEKKEDFDEINQKILNDSAKEEQRQAIADRIKFLHDVLAEKGAVITANRIKQLLAGKQVAIPRFIEVAEEFIAHKKTEWAATTLKSKRTRLKNLIRYFIAQGLQQITCDDVRKSVLLDLKNWLQKNLTSCKQGHYAKHIELANNILDFAVDKEYIKENPLRMTVERGTEEKPMPLKKSHYQKLLNFTTKDKELRIVADSFIFMACTGLAFIDYLKFDTTKQIYTSEVDGKVWLCKDRSKSTIETLVPLRKEALDVLLKYDNRLPYLGTFKSANQLHNRHLKTIAKLLDIPQELSTKHARQTACSRWIGDGVSDLVICKLMGWTSTKQLRYYVDWSEELIRQGLRM